MPPTFQDRERAFEAKFAHDEEFRFLAFARRDKLFAAWAATALGMSGAEADDLTKAVLAIPGGRGHDQALLDHVDGLLVAAGRKPETKLPEVLERCLRDARAQLLEKPQGQFGLG
jgi:hypothetical protein